MSISSIPSSPPPPHPRQKPESLEIAGPDHDGDADNRPAAAATSGAPKPVVNTSGQTTGLVVNTKA